MTVKRLPAEVFHPSEYIQDFVIELGWTREQFAIMTGLTRNESDQLWDGEANVTPRRALALGKAFRTSTNLWYRLQRSFDAGSVK